MYIQFARDVHLSGAGASLANLMKSVSKVPAFTGLEMGFLESKKVAGCQGTCLM